MDTVKRVLIADASEEFRRLLCDAVSAEPDLELVGETGDGNEALRLIREELPDLVVMDLILSGMDGLEVLRALHGLEFRPQVLVLSSFVRSSVADLAGKTIYSTGKGTTPEYVLNYILTENGIDPAKDVTIEYKSEATEVLSTLQSAGEGAVAVLPQPYVTAAQAQVEGLNVALDLTEEWNKIDPDSQLITGVLAVRSDYAEQHPEELEVFLADYRSSIEWVTANTADAAQLVAEYGIVAKAPLAEKALPACNITYMDGADMKQALSGYLDVLYQQDAASVGGALPGDDFYYGVE